MVTAINSNNSIIYNITSEINIINEVLIMTKKHLKILFNNHLYDLLLVIWELLYNSIIDDHKTVSKMVCCQIIIIDGNSFKIILEDEGSGFEYNNLRKCLSKKYSQISKKGYIFLNALSSNIEFNEKGNKVTITVSLNNKENYS